MKPVIALFVMSLIACAENKKQNELRGAPDNGSAIYRVAEMNTRQISSLDNEKTIVLITGGILEEHGPFLPVYSDGYWNERFTDTLAKMIASNTGRKVLIFPSIPLGNSGANDIGSKYSFPGTYAIRFETMRAVFMDLATELGEQGFRNIFVIHGHGAPNHQRAIDQASDYFNEVYKGKIINLFGLAEINFNWFSGEMTESDKLEDGLSIHSGMTETSAMLFIVPQLVDSEYKTAVPFAGNDMRALIQHAKKMDWPGYFGSPRLATSAFGEKAWEKNVSDYSRIVLDILDEKINPDTLLRFSDVMKESREDRVLDSLSLREEMRRKESQKAWLNKHKLF